MIFGTDFRKSPETIGAAQLTPVEFNRGMPKYAIALWTFVVTGANNGIAGTGIFEYEQMIDNDLTISILPAELRALFEYIYSRMGGSVPAAGMLNWHFPFYLLSMLAPKINGGDYPEVGLPAGTDKVWRVNLDPGGAASAGNEFIGWKKSPRPVTHSPLMNGKALSGLNASSPDEQYEINWQPVATCGVIINGLSHFSRIRIHAADAKGFTTQLCDITPTQILELMDPYNVQSITDPLYIPFDVPTVFGKDSYILFTTTAGYTGAERIIPVQLVQEEAPAAAK